MKRFFLITFKKYIFLLIFSLLINIVYAQSIPESARSKEAIKKHETTLKEELLNKGCKSNPALFIRIFKEEDAFEVWAKDTNQNFILFKTYKICYFSGGLGTKTKKGDGKSPEGFYQLMAGQMNPSSNYHLSINTGYPNALEKAKGYTGSAIMIHGDCVSIGCYAMRDKNIEEIWTLLYLSFKGNKIVPCHIFPFRLSDEKLNKKKDSEWHTFWCNLKEGYDYFEKNNKVPSVHVCNKKYCFK